MFFTILFLIDSFFLSLKKKIVFDIYFHFDNFYSSCFQEAINSIEEIIGITVLNEQENKKTKKDED